MGTRTSWVALLVTAGVALAPMTARGQDYTPPDPVLPLPLYSNRPESGGLFVASEFMFMKETNPLKNQIITFRGLEDFDGSITQFLTGQQVVVQGQPPQLALFPNVPGSFLGSGTPALNADQLRGPADYQPGFNLVVGWRFADGVVLEAEWWHLFSSKYSQAATLVPQSVQIPPLPATVNGTPVVLTTGLLADTFLFSPVFNFPNDYAGPPQKVAIGNPFAAYGIWNGASVETEQFVQRYEQFDLTARIPIYQNDFTRCYGLLGPRLVWFWENFTWRTVSENFKGLADATDAATYSQVTSNRLYGIHFGGGTEWRLGDTPIGTFSASLDLQGFTGIDVVKERAKYELGDKSISAARNVTTYSFSPGVQGTPTFWWYPMEGVQIKIGYDFISYWDTKAAPYPVDFNYGNLNPGWVNQFRYIEGFNAGIGFIF